MTDFSKLKVPELRAELKRRGLLQTGLKNVLVERLAAAENEEGSESEATVQALDTHSAAATSPDTVSPVLPPSADGLPDAPPQTAPETPTETADPEQATQDSSTAEAQSDLPPSQPTATIESSQPPETKDSHQSALPSVEPTDANDDRQKRKRRSQSPPPSATDSARKRFRPNDDDAIENAITHSDGGLVEQHGVDACEMKAAVEVDHPPAESSEPAVVDTKMVGVEVEAEVKGDTVVKFQEQKEDVDLGDREGEGKRETPEVELEGASHDNSTSRRDSRFKNLFPETSAVSTSAAMGDIREPEEFEPERDISPAIHPATPALYIRDFMRPLNPAQLQAHLAHLAAPPGHDDDPDVIVKFYIDPIRTHALVCFRKVSAAARVRSALHDRIWPDEKTRKPLWVDFIPAEKVNEWIELENDNRAGGRAGKKWEVNYNIDEDRHVTATLQEVGSISGSNQSIRAPSLPMSSPQNAQPLRNINIPTGPLLIRGQAAVVATGRERLDVLFKCTTSKPALYWQPVSKERVDRRLDRLDGALSKDAAAGRLIQGDIHRYTFEDGDILVDRGPEIFPGIRPPHGFRGPSGFPSRGGGGGFPSRGGYGGQSYRGGGQNFSGRGYDSYRGGASSGRDGGNRGGGRDRDDRRDDHRSSRDYGSSRRY
ncbi:hypothetical protein BKA65DRAFT_515431 [Rhexocercosporidium sp. MPI-PUGE-AT-0058]|nr:hypothetical protein BKA65DRAFT_515431 [Rhexocercosporidium sp. MPI-PUGE-AT-0058]